MRTLPLSSLMVWALAGCGDDAGVGGGVGAGGAGGAPPAACQIDPNVAPASFSDRTAEWGLGAITGPAASTSVSAADIDGDGYPDLVVHGFGDRMPVSGAERFIRVLLNRGQDGGGRTFVDATEASGYPGLSDDDPESFRSAYTAVFGDVDNDGDLDVVSGTFNSHGSPTDPGYADRTRVLLNDGTGVFSYAPPSDISPEDAAAVASVTLVDFDLDGRLDVFESVWFSASGGVSKQPLLTGQGDGTFTDVADLYNVDKTAWRRPGFGSTACDLDGDGSPELLTQSYGRTPNMLWRFAGDSFVDEGEAAGYAFDDNLDYSQDSSFLCWCAANAADARCADASPPQVVCNGVPPWIWGVSDQPKNLGGNTFSTACGDVNGDGKLDLFTGEIAHWWAGPGSDPTRLLLQAESDPLRFDAPTRESTGLEWPHESVDWDEGGLYTTMTDFDNDGRMDLVIGAGDYANQFLMLYHQEPDGKFTERAKASGIDHPCASSPVVADFDRDGDVDLVVAASLWRTCTEEWGGIPEVRFYENDASERARGVSIRLAGDGTTTNRTAIGARVTVRAGDLSLVRVVDGGHGHSAMQDDTVVSFGINGCTTIDAIEVAWPNQDRETQVFEDVPASTLLEITQGSAAPVVVLP